MPHAHGADAPAAAARRLEVGHRRAACWCPRPGGPSSPALIAVVFGPAIEQVAPGLGLRAYVVAPRSRSSCWLSVLAARGRRTPVATRFGLPVTAIAPAPLRRPTPRSTRQAPTPARARWIAVVGPAANGALALAGSAAGATGPDGLLGAAVVGAGSRGPTCSSRVQPPPRPARWTAAGVLEPLVWGVHRQPHRGTIVAGWGGRAVTVAGALLRARLPAAARHATRAVHVVVGVHRAPSCGRRDPAPSAARLRRRLPAPRGARSGPPYRRRAERPAAGRGADAAPSEAAGPAAS